MLDTAVIKKENRMEINNESRILNSKRTLDGCNSYNKVQRKRQKLYLDKENKMLTLTDCSYLEKDANTNPTETVSEEDNTDKGSLKNVGSIDNENDIDLPALAIPRKRLLKNPRKCLIQSENDLLPSSKNSENKNKQCSDSFGSFSAISDMLISKGPLSLENGIDVPHHDDFENNLKSRDKNEKVFTSKSNAFRIVVGTEVKCKKNKSVSRHSEITSGDEFDGNQLDQTSGVSTFFYTTDTQDEGDKFDANDFFISNNSIVTSSLQHLNDSNDSAKQKAEQKQKHEYSSLSKENYDMKMSKFDKSEKNDTKILSPTQTKGIDSLSKNSFEAKPIKTKTEKQKQQKARIGKENGKATSNKKDVSTSSLQGSLPTKMEFWDPNNLIQKILIWNPVWFDEYGKVI